MGDARRPLPRALAPGDLVAVVAPASRPDPETLERGVEALRARGLRVSVGRHGLDAYGHLAGHDRDRAADVMEAFLAPDVSAVICARGGSGSARIIPYLDLPAIALRPRVFVGYSDITALHLAFARSAGWPTFYGPMVAAEIGSCCQEQCWQSLWRLVSRPEAGGVLSAGTAESSVRTLVPGVCEGRLVGGTLCVIQTTLGTPYQIDTTDAILAIEDAQEPAWRVDRMLTQLAHAGLLERAAGFVVGVLHDPAHPDGTPDDLAVELALAERLRPLGKPTIVGFPFGHLMSPVSLPLNCMARLDADAGTLAVLEPAVAPYAG